MIKKFEITYHKDDQGRGEIRGKIIDSITPADLEDNPDNLFDHAVFEATTDCAKQIEQEEDARILEILRKI